MPEAHSDKNNGPLVDLAVESWRFSKLFLKVLTKLDGGEGQRYFSQYTYFSDRLRDHLAEAGLKLVNLEGQPYEAGMAISALNLDEFAPGDALIVTQMLDPVIMGEAGVVRPGCAMLGKA
jgi:hypothetical protein